MQEAIQHPLVPSIAAKGEVIDNAFVDTVPSSHTGEVVSVNRTTLSMRLTEAQIDNAVLDTIVKLAARNTHNVLGDTLQERVEKALKLVGKTQSDEPFVIVPHLVTVDLAGVKVVHSNKLMGALIVGFKQPKEEPGVALVYNESNLDEADGVQAAVIELGYYPHKRYVRFAL